MISTEKNVLPGSDYYIHTPSLQAQSCFFYPCFVGRFSYASGYELHRNSYDSYLIMAIHSGSCQVTTVSADGQPHTFSVHAGELAILNCYHPHSYTTAEGFQSTWMHFDGITAKAFTDMLPQQIFSTRDCAKALTLLEGIYDSFRHSSPLREADLSLAITEILTVLLQAPSATTPTYHPPIENSLLYLKEHMREAISLNQLAKRVNLSPFYFTRLFRQETGFTPHQYLISLRLQTAKYLLKTTEDSIKSICFATGFPSESNFCKTFKEKEGITPSQFRYY